MALMNNYDYFKENVGVAEQSTGTLEQQAEIYAESWEAAQKRVRAAAEGVYQDLIDDKFFISLNNGLADIISGLDNFIDKAGGLKTIIMALSGVILANFSNKIPEAIDKARYNFDVLTKGSDKAYQKILTQMNSVTEDQFKKYDTYQDAKNKGKDTSKLEKGINRDSAFGVELKQANQLTALKLRYAGVEDKLSDAEKQRYQTELNIIEAQQKQQLVLTQQTETLRQNVELKKQALLDTDVNEVALGKYSDQSSINQLENLSTHNEGGQYNTLISDTRDFLQFLDVANNDIAEQYNTMNRTMLEALTDPDIDTKSFKLFTDDMSSNFFDQIAKMSDTLGDLEGTEQAGAAINTVRNNLRSLSSLIPQTIRQATGLDKAFRQVNIAMASGNVDEIQEALSNLMESFDKATINGENFGTVLQSLHGKSVTELKEMFLDLGLSEEQAEENAKTLKASVDSLNPQHVITVSEAFGNLASGVMSAYAIIDSTKSVIASLNDEDLSAWEKFGTIISGIMVIGPNLASLGKSVKAVGTFATGAIPALGALSGKLGTLVTSITGVGAATATVIGTAAVGLGIIVAVGLAIWGIVSAVKAFQKASPEGQLKALQSATEEMEMAAQKANSAYQELKNTFDSYNSGIDNLHGLKEGTQEFTDALINANEQAWELIEKYNLIKNEDWYIGDSGEIIIREESQKAKEEEQQRTAAKTEAAVRNMKISAAAQQLEVDQETAENALIGGAFSEISWENVVKGLINPETNTFDQELFNDYAKASDNYDTERQNEIEDLLGKRIYGDEYDPNLHRIAVGSLLSKEELAKTFLANWDNYNRLQTNLGSQNLTTLMQGNSDYQDSQFKNEIIDYGNSLREDTINDLKSDLLEQNNTGQLKEKLKEYLPEDYEIKGNNVVDEEGNKVEGLSNLTDDKIADFIARNQADEQIVSQMELRVEDINAFVNGLKGKGKDAFEMLTGDLTSDDIEKLKEKGGPISFEDLFGEDSNFKAKMKELFSSDAITEWLNHLNEQIEHFQPAEFDLEAWQSDYEQQLTAAEQISKEGIIKDKYFDELSPELQQYFQDLQNGTHVLTISADEFNQKIREISQQELEDSIHDSLYAIQNGVSTFEEKVGIETTPDEMSEIAETMLKDPTGFKDSTAFDAMANIMGFSQEDLNSLGSTEEQIKAVAQAWLELTGELENKRIAFGASTNSIDDLDAALINGTINIEAYNKAFDGVIANEVVANDLDYSSITNYTEYLLENNEQLKNNGKTLEENTRIAKKLSVAHAKLNKGVETISKNWESWDKVIKSGRLDDIQDILPDINKSLKQILDISDETFKSLDSDFAVQNWDLIKDVIDGVDGSYEKLQLKVAEGLAIKLIGQDKVSGDMTSLMDSLISIAEGTNLEIGPEVNNDNALNALYELLSAAGMTVDDIASLFDSLGWQPELDFVKMDTESAAKTHNYGYMEVPEMTGYGQWSGKKIDLNAEDQIKGVTEVWVPVIKSATKKGGSKSYTPQSPKSSGGGKGSTKSSSHADQKNYSDKERYHTIKNQIEDLNSAYDDLNKAKDRAFGKDRLKYMDSEISKTQELIDAQEEYLRQIRANLPTDKSIMEEAYNSYIGGPGIEYDESGNISNFDEIQDAMFEEYNRMAQKYTDDSDEWKIFEKKYELLEKYIEQYEETYDLLRDQKQELQDLINQKIDIGLEQVQYSVEVKLDIPDDKIKFLEYRLGRIDDDAFKSIEAVTLLTKKADEVYKKIQINKEALNDVLKLSLSVGEITQLLAGDTSVLAGKSFTEDQINAIKEYRDNLLDLNSELDDLRENIEEKVMDTFDAWKEKVDAGISSIEHYGNILGSFRNIIDIVGKDTLGISGTFMNNLAQGTVDNAINKLEGTKKAYETIVKARDEASSKLAEAEARKDDASIKMWKDTLDQINEEIESSSEEMMSAWEDALSGIADQFENTMNDLIDTFNDSVYYLGGLDGLADDFSRQKDNADLMLDDYEKIYELSKLNRDINKSINDVDSISGKQKLKKLLEQINDLQEDGNEMSKYDLEYLQKTYDLRLAEIELEEAQRAKNTVRLQKDSEGNWSYIYTQSSDAIDSAQQKYEDALYAMQDLSSNYIDEMSDKLISTSKEMEEALAAIRIQDYASIDDYYAAVQRVQDQYQEQLEKQQDELQKALDNNKQLYDEDWQNYHDATGYKISDLEDFATTFKDTMLGTLLGSESDTANFTDLIKDSVYNLTLGLEQAAETYYDNLEKAMQAAGTSTSGFAEDATEGIQQVVDASKEGTDAVNDMADQMKTAFDEITEFVGQWQENYSQNMEEIINSNLQVIKSFNDMLQALSIDPDSITVKYDIAKAAKDQDIDSYDTGGYTGNWGSSGKLAMLHSKELVLNAGDTANMLTAVQITRAMLDTIDLNARQASFGLGSLVASGIRDEKDNTLKQEVSIVAQFPNVQNHSEIEEALSNLINHASQYANRK